MIVLALDTSTPQGAVALVRDGRLLAETTLRLESHHSTQILPAAQWLFGLTGLNVGDVDLFACARGPGSFTGLRIGIAACRGLATASGKPAVGIGTLDAVAYPHAGAGRPVGVVLDARKGQVYFQLFRGEGASGVVPLGEPVVILPGAVCGRLTEETLLVGGGVDVYRAVLADLCGRFALLPPEGLCYHSAAVIGQLALKAYRAEGGDVIEPLYVRAFDAEPAVRADRPDRS